MKRCSPLTSPARVEGLDADVVEIGRAMHRRDRVRLGDDEQVPGRARVHGFRRSARWAWACVRRRLGRSTPSPDSGTASSRSSVPPASQAIFAVAKEGEVVVFHPLQQFLGLDHFAARQSGRVRFQFARERPRTLAHLHPVARGAAHVIEHREDAFLDAIEALRISDAVDFEELPGLRQRMLELARSRRSPRAASRCGRAAHAVSGAQ